MRISNQGRLREQVRFLQRQFLQSGDLPFTNVLSEKIVVQAMTAIDVIWKDRIYSPLVTLWVFLGQVLSADHSCRWAVARLIAHRLSQGQRPCAAETGAYCQARKRLPEKFFSDVARKTGRSLDANVRSGWLWKERPVYMFDGATVMMPDTQENQKAYPQNASQKPGLGFPIARIAAIFSLSCGAIVDLGICRYAGKGQGESSLFRTLWDLFCPGDIVLTDSLLCTWTEIVMLKQRGIDFVSQLHVTRDADFRRGKRLGEKDHIVRWSKPTTIRWVDRQTYKSLPDFLEVRECCISIQQAGFRSKTIVVVTTLLDADEYTKDDLAEIYFRRWNAELDLRSLKTVMQMEMLRCKTPELVRKEIWTHILAYNLIRTIMAQAATKHGINPRSISFKGAIQTLEAFQQLIAFAGQHHAALCMHIYPHLLDAIASHRVANRPGRFEPRQIKRRHGKYDLLTKPRRETKLELLQGVRHN